MYGYIFEHEATYDRMCLVNNAVYIAKYKDGKHAGEWTATGTQFQIPYVFKKLFSHEEITFEDMCETKSVTSAIYIDRSPDEAAAYINNPDMAIPVSYTHLDVYKRQPHFPDTISEVIWQKNQYAGMYGDRITRCYVIDELVKLVEEELENRTDYDVVFFNAGHYSDYGVPMFQVGNHYFSSYD